MNISEIYQQVSSLTDYPKKYKLLGYIGTFINNIDDKKNHNATLLKQETDKDASSIATLEDMESVSKNCSQTDVIKARANELIAVVFTDELDLVKATQEYEKYDD
jgi:hypothetical protein